MVRDNKNINKDCCFILENRRFKIRIAKDRPTIFDYRSKDNGGIVYGDSQDAYPTLTICKGHDFLTPASFKVHYNVVYNNKNISYLAQVVFESKTVISLNIEFKLFDDGICIEYNNVLEIEDFHLMNVQMPKLLTVKAEHNDEKMIIPVDTGRLIDISTASCRDYQFQIDWICPSLIGAVSNDKIIGILETDSYENTMISSVNMMDDIKYGSISMNFIYRLTDFDVVEFGQKLPAKNADYHLKVQDSCIVKVSLLSDYDCDKEASWVDAAKYIRAKIDSSVNPFYQDKLISKIALELPDSEDIIMFDDVLDYIKIISFVTNNQPQVLYLVGWQYNGHDTGYPSVDKVNEKLGGYDKLVNLIHQAKEYNTVVSFHDNYDDAYMTSPAWDPSVIALDSKGELMKSGNFGTGQAYLLSNYKYAQKYGEKRVNDTLDKYPISKTYHIDVLSGGFKGGRKYDFDPNNPSAAKKNLEGKLMVVNEFMRRDIDVTTEDFSSLFIGQISHFWHLNFLDRVFYRNEVVIPMIPFIYHSKASYGRHCNSKIDVIYALLHGATYSCDINRAELSKQISYYFLVALPLLKIYGKEMKKYSRFGDIETIVYDDNSYIEVNFEKVEYKVVVHGEMIAKNFQTFILQEDKSLICFSLEEDELIYKFIDQIDEQTVVSVDKLKQDCTTEVIASKVVDNSVIFRADKNSIYRIRFEHV